MTEIVIEEGQDVDAGTFREFWVDVDRHGLRSTLSVEQAGERVYVKWYVDGTYSGPRNSWSPPRSPFSTTTRPKRWRR
ncbi:hypothetical protein, partial [Streptomyces xanthochromogenes]